MASACCHACRLPCRHLAVQASAHSASQRLMPNRWLKLQVFHTSANLISTIRSTLSTKYGRSHCGNTPLICSAQAFVAQWIEHLTSDQRVGGSSPSERTNNWCLAGPSQPHPSTDVLVVFSMCGCIFLSTTMQIPAVWSRVWLWQKNKIPLLSTRLHLYPI